MKIENTEHSVVIVTTIHKEFVAFCFSRVSEQPKVPSELRALPWLNRQRRMIQAWAVANNYKLVEQLWATTTHAGTAFSDSPKFREAVHLAGELECHLVMADISDSLSRTPIPKIVACMKLLDAIAVDVWDASRNCTWQSLSVEVRNELGRRAMAVQLSRARPIRAGLKSAGTRKKPSADNSKRGSLANQTKADAFARRHENFVLAEMAKLPPNDLLSPSSLARALNDAGRLSSRSGLWTHNSAKNLIERVNNFEKA